MYFSALQTIDLPQRLRRQFQPYSHYTILVPAQITQPDKSLRIKLSKIVNLLQICYCCRTKSLESLCTSNYKLMDVCFIFLSNMIECDGLKG